VTRPGDRRAGGPDDERRATDLAAQRITETLQRIADGTYGRCEECDEPIPPARLKAIPTATLCVPCQSAAEFRAAARRTPGRRGGATL